MIKERINQIIDEILEKVLNEPQNDYFTRIMTLFSLYHLKNKDSEVIDLLKTHLNDRGMFHWTTTHLIAKIDKEINREYLIAEIEKLFSGQILITKNFIMTTLPKIFYMWGQMKLI